MTAPAPAPVVQVTAAVLASRLAERTSVQGPTHTPAPVDRHFWNETNSCQMSSHGRERYVASTSWQWLPPALHGADWGKGQLPV